MKKTKTIIIAFILIMFLIIIPNALISNNTEKYLFDIVDVTPKNKVGLVLGTQKYLSNGQTNLYYTYRLDAVISLYNANKIDFILISGDNSNKNYDEPTDFKNDLIKKGIPKDKIFLDYAGFRTLDSVVRAKEIFSLNEFTIISQKFHNERAIFLCKHYQINAIAFNAKDISGKYGFKTKLREYLARTKACIDILFNVNPKFLGEKVNIS